VAAVVIVGVGASRPTPSPELMPSAPAVVPPIPSPTASTLGTCSEGTTVTTGDAMPPTTTVPMTIPEGVLDQGVYLTGPADRSLSANIDVWSIRAGSAARIASIHSDGYVRIDDVSADGQLAMLEMGRDFVLSEPACSNLFVLRTDGSGSTRVTDNGQSQQATDARFSADGRFIAFSQYDLNGSWPAVGLVDLSGDPVPRFVDCGENSRFDHAWAPDDNRLAVVCGGTLEIMAADQSLEGSSTALTFGDEVFLELSWADSERTVLTTAVTGGTSSGPLQLRTVAAGVVSEPMATSPTIGWIGPDSAVAPDGHAVAVAAATPDGTGGWFVIDVATAATQAVAGGGCSGFGWSRDGRSVLYVEGDPATFTTKLTVVDVATGTRQTVGTMPENYAGGFFRGA
jgi:dipeptidyl aminopeptidase/acylaminoacyl peptidase